MQLTATACPERSLGARSGRAFLFAFATVAVVAVAMLAASGFATDQRRPAVPITLTASRLAPEAASSEAIVQSAVTRASNMSFEEMADSGALSPGQMRQLLNNPNTSPMLAGHMVHNIAHDLLEAENPGRFIYNPSLGPDIADTISGAQVEVATEAQGAMKALKYPWAKVATYRWNPWLSGSGG